MADKKGSANRMIGALAGAAAAFAARKLINLVWKQVTGHEPPEHPEDPQVALSEALLFGVLLGAGVQVARLLATRATSRHPASADETSGDV
jgi:hypothetical protein